MTKFSSIRVLAALVVSALAASPATEAAVKGITGSSFNLSAKAGYISVADGGSIYSWGYADNAGGAAMQLPGPTLIVTEGVPVTITLHNDLPKAAGNVSMVFMGQQVTASGGVSGALTNEAVNGGDVIYTFTPSKPGTYQYHSGTRADLQVEMGLYGAMIVRPEPVPASCVAMYSDAYESGAAYNHPDACYDREFLFVTSSIDYQLHKAVEQQSTGAGPIVLPPDAFESSEYWLLNGRVGPDTMAIDGTATLPHQPYGSLAHMHPGEKILMRVVGGGREMHPFHHHGNHSRVLARDGNMLLTDTDHNGVLNSLDSLAGPRVFTIPSMPGTTTDAIFEWTGKDMGWDIYGHTAGDGTTCTPDANGFYTDDPAADNYMEYCADHTKPLPVTLPSFNNMAFGGFFSGSPYLGDPQSTLPPGEGGLNPGYGFVFIWHSHTERELVNNDVFPGGMMTMMIVEAPFVGIVE
jgi:hypothetical protein